MFRYLHRSSFLLVCLFALLAAQIALGQGQSPSLVVTSPAAGSVTANALPVSPGSGWSESVPSVNERIYTAAASLNGKVFHIGGYINAAASDEVTSFDPETNTWTTHSPLNVARYSRHYSERQNLCRWWLDGWSLYKFL